VLKKKQRLGSPPQTKKADAGRIREGHEKTEKNKNTKRGVKAKGARTINLVEKA